jgi:ABC-2 type transport system ATP-binding protein
LRRSDKISLKVRTPPPNLAERVRAVSGVVSVLASTGGDYLVECELGRDVREELARLVVTSGWGLLEMKPVSMTLEDVFLRLTQHDEAGAPQEATA